MRCKLHPILLINMHHHLFKAELGLRINLSKSEIVPIGEVMNVEELASNLRRHVLMKYLGMPLGAHFKARYIWDSIIDKCIRDWLAGSNCTYLKGGDSL